jgi:hypothetical protein
LAERIEMARVAAVTVPAREITAVLEALITLYEVKAEALSFAAIDYLNDPPTLPALQERQRELAAIEEMIGEIGWDPRERLGAAEIAGPPGLVREALLGALIHAAEGLPEACHRYEAGGAELGDIRAALDCACRLLDLFATVERPAAG